MFARSVAAPARPTRNLDTFDPERERLYEVVQLRVHARGPVAASRSSAGSRSSGSSTSRARRRTIRTFDGIGSRQRHLLRRPRERHPVPQGLQARPASMPLVWGITVSGVFQSNHGIAARNNATGGEVMAVTRSTTRYPRTCPAPCPAGQIIMPTAMFGQASMTVNLVDGDTVYTERINQLDLRVGQDVPPPGHQSSRRRSRSSTSTTPTRSSPTRRPTCSSASYLRPNSIMQGRMMGLNVQTRGRSVAGGRWPATDSYKLQTAAPYGAAAVYG